MNLLILVILAAGIAQAESRTRLRDKFSSSKSKEISAQQPYRRNRVDRGFIYPRKSTPSGSIRFPSEADQKPGQTSKSQFELLIKSLNEPITTRTPLRNKFEKLKIHKPVQAQNQPQSQEVLSYTRPNPHAPGKQNTKTKREESRTTSRASRRKNSKIKKKDIPRCKHTNNNNAYSCYKNIHRYNGFRDNSEAAIKYLKAESCRKGKKENSRSKRRKKCEKTKQPFRLSAETDKHTSRKQQYQKRANDPNMIFEKVTLEDYVPCGGDTSNEKTVVKVGFYNVATDTWISINGSQVILQRYPNNRDPKHTKKETEFIEHTTKGKKKGHELYEYLDAQSGKGCSGSSSKSRRKGVFLALTHHGEFILIKTSLKAAQEPRKRQCCPDAAAGSCRHMSVGWNQGPPWIKKSKKILRTRNSRRTKERKLNHSRTGSRLKPDRKCKKIDPKNVGENDLKYSLYFMSVEASPKKQFKPQVNKPLLEAFSLRAKLLNKRSKGRQ